MESKEILIKINVIVFHNQRIDKMKKKENIKCWCVCSYENSFTADGSINDTITLQKFQQYLLKLNIIVLKIEDMCICSSKDTYQNIYIKTIHINLKLYSPNNSQINTIQKKFLKNIILKKPDIKIGQRIRFHLCNCFYV